VNAARKVASAFCALPGRAKLPAYDDAVASDVVLAHPVAHKTAAKTTKTVRLISSTSAIEARPHVRSGMFRRGAGRSLSDEAPDAACHAERRPEGPKSKRRRCFDSARFASFAQHDKTLRGGWLGGFSLCEISLGERKQILGC
jgi:hypothetical protein